MVKSLIEMDIVSNIELLREELKKLILSEAVLFGEFTLSSGRKSNYYIDAKNVTLSARGSYLIAQILLSKLIDLEVDAIGGMSAGADPIATAVSVLSSQTDRPIAAFTIRKEEKKHGSKKRIEGPLKPAAKVVIVDDVITTGAAALEAASVVEKEKDCLVSKIICLVDRKEGAAENIKQAGYLFESIFDLNDLGIKL
jgi:orotate phosphoribosyltransferase